MNAIMSREALIDELFATALRPATAIASDVCDRSRVAREHQLHRALGIARELLLGDLQTDLRHAPLMDRPQALREWLALRFAGLDREVFLVVFLDSQHRLIDSDTMFRGTLTQTAVYPREVVRAALAHNAAAVAFAHNHPSGVPEPSRADEVLTATLKTALALVDIRVIDHFIVAGDQLVSMAERGLM
ncbi:JAB domain-containing protein [Paracidovorax anthurii]|uniref:DNA repair protein RadC n=1 Tax=Paracidovorax anthurii TaxID=78229 RepID=A0A328YXK6_9BURK|nr:JAB domain-containing protein [Paracidovorax anthurii]RAR78144.1 DNA repair protein RadC [Paracidovorax anthurii]